MSSQKPLVLVVDDDESMRFLLMESLKKEGCEVVTALSADEALGRMKEKSFDVAILDVRMPKVNGLELLEKIKEIDSGVVIILITAYGFEKMAIKAAERGAYDYFTKPFDVDKMRESVRSAVRRRRLDTKKGQHPDVETEYSLDEIIGKSEKIREIYEVISKVSNTDVTVLLHGESGTGKELVARAIHYNSPRKDKPFVEMSCSAIPETLLESELFGYEKGAFTGASDKKLGKFEIANRGTLFLDEVGDMSLFTQAKVLRVLQEKRFERVGGTKPISVDVRIIAATNKNLMKMAKNGEFREDLYYRLNVVPIFLPPLRERREDIPLLFEHFVRRFNKRFNRKIRDVSVDAMELLMNYRWPGNIRELENVLQKAIILEEQETLTKRYLPDSIQSVDKDIRIDLDSENIPISLHKAVEKVVENVEKRVILNALDKSGGNKTKAAEAIKISRKSLHNKMRKYSLGK